MNNEHNDKRDSLDLQTILAWSTIPITAVVLPSGMIVSRTLELKGIDPYLAGYYGMGIGVLMTIILLTMVTAMTVFAQILRRRR